MDMVVWELTVGVVDGKTSHYKNDNCVQIFKLCCRSTFLASFLKEFLCGNWKMWCVMKLSFFAWDKKTNGK